MKAVIDLLKALNKLDVRLRTLKKDMDRLPKELNEKQQPPKNMRAALERVKADILRLKIDADNLELEVKSGEETLRRYSGQMGMMRSGKETDTLRRQMDAQRAWNKENESKALAIMEQVDAKQKDVEKNTVTLAEAEKVVAAEAERIEKELAELRSQYDALAAERGVAAKDIPEKELATYNRIVSVRGEAIANVERGTSGTAVVGICSACRMKLPPQIHNLALLGRELVTCPSCMRILTTP